MKKIIVLFLLVLGGCSKIEPSKTEEVNPKAIESKQVEFEFKGKKLLITNHSEKIMTLIESDTTFSIEEKGKWQTIDQISGSLSITYNVLSKEVYEYDLTKELSEIGSNKIKVTVFYTFETGDETSEYEKELIYKE
ncbi:hypothetical protein ATZ33_01155 [Enterococcus silesiacus]|uniref:Intracellular proteinase inhibitor BsuPI domain-containing protein n=1 Tax=Enterococcus silesiacus TaxID=332949 RepID=A0A0S3K6U5_9ENTE|nr:hypothetical protein [Enterococcus silesiacus]ALS00038.1 hypothetical protein ATZ33_01155 [Enterococcus silesiacus]OJG86737.1 hypothetical protein RV15_GL002335 [Enterococcus silesiacus]